VIGPRLARDREIDAPNNLLMVATGAGFLWLGWNGFNGGDPYYAGADAAAAVLNTNICTAVALLVWISWDYMTGRKPSLLGTVNGMIVGLVAITPGPGFVNGYGAILIGVIASSIVYVAYHYVSRMRPFRNVDDTLGVIYTHGSRASPAGCLLACSPTRKMAVYINKDGTPWFSGTGSLHLLKVQAYVALWVILFTANRHVHHPQARRARNPAAHERCGHGRGRHRRCTCTRLYPSDIPSLGYPGGIPGVHPGDRWWRRAVEE